MDHYSLKLFLHLSESLHFGKTSRACHISPSALSRQIQRMERDVGHKLFERDNRSVRITPAGGHFKEYAKSVMDTWQTLQDKLSSGQLKGEIRIYCSVTASISILPDILGQYKTLYPAVQIRLQTGDASIGIQKVLEGDVDISVSALPVRLPKNIAAIELTRVGLDFVAPGIAWEWSEDVNQQTINWSRIPMILSEGGIARKRIDSWFEKNKFQPNIYSQVAGNEAILSMVALGCGVGVVPSLVLENSPIRHRVVKLEGIVEAPTYPVGIAAQKRKLSSPLVNSFWQIACKYPL